MRAGFNAVAVKNLQHAKRATFSSGGASGLFLKKKCEMIGVKLNQLGSRQMAVHAAEIEADTAMEGRPIYRPQTFESLVGDAVVSVKRGMKDGLKRMEVEFPLSSDTSGFKDSSDAFVDANIQLAILAAKLLCEEDPSKTVKVVLPDDVEFERASKKFKTSVEMAGPNVSLGCISVKRGLMWALGAGAKAEDAAPADIHIAVNASTIELPNVRKYCENVVKDNTFILWCLELDTLRADLGLPMFPNKALHYDFLSGFKPVFYLRQRGYSKSVPVAPFVVNYDGALFRTYPAGWQVMLKQDNGELACIAERPKRYNLGELKEELLEIMGLNTEEKGSNLENLRKGYKRATWWEENEDEEKNKDWRY